MGYIEVLNGSGYTLRLENDNESLDPSLQICVSCNDDRLLHDGQYLLCTQCGCRQQYMPIYDENGVRQREAKEWRDEWISERHRTWGYQLPATDIDFMLLEYTGSKPIALIEYKTIGSVKYVGMDKVMRGHAPVSNLADMADLPSFVVVYDIHAIKFWVMPSNNKAALLLINDNYDAISENKFVSFLRQLRGLPNDPI